MNRKNNFLFKILFWNFGYNASYCLFYLLGHFLISHFVHNTFFCAPVCPRLFAMPKTRCSTLWTPWKTEHKNGFNNAINCCFWKEGEFYEIGDWLRKLPLQKGLQNLNWIIHNGWHEYSVVGTVFLWGWFPTVTKSWWLFKD